MVNVSEALVGRRVRVTRADCGTRDCTSCERYVGREGRLDRMSANRQRGRVVADDGNEYSYIAEVELLDTPATATVAVFAPGSVVEVTGDTSDHGWSVGTQVTLTRTPRGRRSSEWLATTRPWFVGAPVPDHTMGSGSAVRFIVAADFRAVTAPVVETFELEGRTFTVGSQMNVRGGTHNPVTILSPTDEGYVSQYGGFTVFVPTVDSSGFIDGHAPAILTHIATTTEETTVPTSTPSSRVMFTPEQQARLREVVGEYGRRHGACAVAADALRELGVEQPQLTQTVSVTITLTVPVANYTGQVQLPSGAPEGYLAKVIPARELNAIADRMIRDAGSAVRRQGDATAEVTTISAS